MYLYFFVPILFASHDIHLINKPFPPSLKSSIFSMIECRWLTIAPRMTCAFRACLLALKYVITKYIKSHDDMNSVSKDY